jgi:hypothetical protein
MRRTITAMFALTVTFVGSGLRAQSGGIMAPTIPSPTAASLGKFGDVPVNMFTGLPDITVPLFTAQGRTLSLPISLTYHASGIKVEEIGGWVGAGWALDAGGVITRTVRGLVDERPEGYFKTGQAFYDPTNWTDNPPSTLLMNIHDLHVDGEPDQFFFNFGGQSGEIVAGPLSTSPTDFQVYTIPYRKWRITPTFGSDPFFAVYAITSWTITVEDGTQYTFSAIEMHHDVTSEWLGQGGRDLPPYASSWYLTQIKAPGGDVITLNYTPYSAEHHMGMYREEVNDTYESPLGVCSIPGYMVGSSHIDDIHSQSFIDEQRLTSITTANQTVTFYNSLRADAIAPTNMLIGPGIIPGQQQEPKLDSIIVKAPGVSGATIRSFALAYDYSLGGRLTLKNVYERGSTGDSLPPYTFTYSGPTLPTRATDRNQFHTPVTASFALDHWGYFNGKSSNTTSIPPGTSTFSGHSYPGADRWPDSNYTKAGVLTRITYPTGGFNDFIYQTNSYSTIANGQQLTPITVDHSAAASITGIGSDVFKDFTIGGLDAFLPGTLTVYINGPCGAQCPFVRLLQGQTALSTWQTGNLNTSVPWQFTQGVTYTLQASTGGNNVTASSINAYWHEHIAVNQRLGAGLRIAEIHADDGMGHVTVHKYKYLASDLVKSSGVIGFEPKYDYNRNAIAGGEQCVYYSRSSESKIPLGGGPAIEYSSVTDSAGATGEFGRTHTAFVAGGDFPSYTQSWPFLRYTTHAWQRGQQASDSVYNAASKVQRATASTYTFPTWTQTTKSFRGFAIDVYSMFYNGAPVFYIDRNRFTVDVGLKLPSVSTTTFFDTLGTTSFSASRQTVFGNPNHAQPTEIDETNSDGTQRITRMKYPADYATGSGNPEAAALTAMQDMSPTGAAMPGVVIERSVSVKAGSTDRVVQAEITTFKQYAAGQYLPYQHFVFNSPSPIP